MERQPKGPCLRLLAVLAAIVAGTALVSLGPQADAQSRSQLRRRQAAIRNRKKDVERQLRKLKVRQKSAGAQLYLAQDRLTKAEAKFQTAQRKLRETQQALRKVKQESEETKKRLDQHTKLFSTRLRNLYAQGDPSYLEVVLGAQDFADFVDRTHRCQQILEQDEKTLNQIIVEKRQLQRKKTELEQRMLEEQRRRTEYQKQRDELRRQKAAVSKALKDLQRDRAKWEGTYAELLQASREIELKLRRLYRGTSRTTQRYVGRWSGSFLRPVSGSISSPFGWRTDPFNHRRRFHTGVDIRSPRGTRIRAAAKGLVIYAGWYGAYGKCVWIDHGSRTATVYGHMLSIYVRPGQLVTRGHIIGTVDSTGRSTGNHLHFEVRKNGTPVNPLRAGL